MGASESVSIKIGRVLSREKRQAITTFKSEFLVQGK